MYTKQDLLNDIVKLGIKPDDTLLIHSSMKSIGQVDGGADTVLDAFSEYLCEKGLLVFPTHTWDTVDVKHNHTVFDPMTEPACVGLLPNMFMKRKGVIRSLHPTHSVAALGHDAAEYVEGEMYIDTPCGRNGCWGKLYDRKAKILFIGCNLKHNTFLHGVEEWNNIPDRLDPEHKMYYIILPDGTKFERPFRRHYSVHARGVSVNYDKVAPMFYQKGIIHDGKFGDAKCVLCDAVGMADSVTKLLKENPELFSRWD